MPSFCAVIDCNDKYGHGHNGPFHKFPKGKNKELLEKWIEFTQRPKNWRPSKWMSVCGQHFRDEDYRCSEQKKLLKRTAIPTVRTTQYPNATRHGTHKSQNTVPSDAEEEEEETSDLDEAVNKSNDIASNCRFCGFTTSTFITFAGNFEIFAEIQKCLPTLSIRQDDNMPKEICKNCLKLLKTFASFIDKVIETQTALQQKFRNEKGSSTKPNERVLKIKQEPSVIRVKQENIDDVNAFFPDEVDDGCCGDHDVSNIESNMDQKFQFCDFPVLNDQDIINNCDIMEIINLSDPFIDITNCENTIAEEGTLENSSPKQQNPILPSAHDLLQTHFLNEEHNYANFAEDFKAEWPMRDCYKTEKIEADDEECYGAANCTVESAGIEDFVQDIDSYIPEDDDDDVAATATVYTTTATTDEYERSNKPIVTSVSSLHEVNILPIAQSFNDTKTPYNASRKKPNIVVLNESIVQSSHALQLQECNMCQSKFFSIDSLNHHYGVAHRTPINFANNNQMQPMVIVPSSNITEDRTQGAQIQVQSYKTEKDICQEGIKNDTSFYNLNHDQQSQNIPKRSSKNEITILDMQQTFLQHQYPFTNQLQVEQNSALNQLQPTQSETLSNQLEQANQNVQCPSIVLSQHVTDNTAQKKISSDSEYNVVASQFLMPYYSSLSDTNTKPNIIYEPFPAAEIQSSSNGNFEKITTEFLELQKRYRRLKVKCRKLSHDEKTKKKQQNLNRKQLNCRICDSQFHTIIQLLRHKQSVHRIRRKVNSHLYTSCAGCGKFFSRKTALFNHMRHICQSLPLRWIKHQTQTFKCRYCRFFTFTHWRLYRRHEIQCQFRKKERKHVRNSAAKTTKLRSVAKTNTRAHHQYRNSKVKISRPRKKSRRHVCDQCKKSYSSSSSLNQHRITHTNLRQHQCDICQRIFKRRNGLTQHVRGFHMKLKPFECPKCKHTYALKGDMRRCKHSDLSRVKKK